MRARILLPALLLACHSAWSASLVRGLGPEPDSLHIHAAQGLSAINLLREIREGLLTYDQHGQLAPGVATSWQVLDGGLRYRFALREQARWSNGDPVVADDFIRAWRLAVAPATAAANAALLGAVENARDILAGRLEPAALGIEALSSRQLEVRLSQPAVWFPEILAHPVSFPLHPDASADPRTAPVNGAFKIARLTPHALVRLEANPQFHAAPELALESVDYLPIEDPASELARFRAGELHITETLPPGRFEWLRENLGRELQVHPYLGSFWLGLNLKRAPLSGNPALRQALALAIDRETLVGKVLGAGELAAWSIVPPGLDGYVPQLADGAALDRGRREALARKLFAESGAGRDGPLRLELRFNSSSQHRRVAVAVAAMWKQVLGVHTQLLNEEWKVFVNNRRQGVRTQVFRGGWIADYADAASFLDLFRAENEQNWSFYANADFDALMRQADVKQGSERIVRLQEAESLLMRDMPAIPLYYYVSRHLVNISVRGFHPNVRDIHLSRYMDLDSDPR
jgi:oligopeptide transport system substrate-binding protein